MIEVESQVLIRSSREALWRHLTRISEWPRWYPGLHGVNASESVTRAGHTWRSSGQMGRLLYRSDNEVTEYRVLECMTITGDRRPWIRHLETRIDVQPEGPNCRVNLKFSAQPGMSMLGRLVLVRSLRNRLEDEANAFCERLASYVEHTLPHH